METEVLTCGPSRFTQTGQRLPSQVFGTNEKISEGLASRILSYALNRLKEDGFLEMVRDWDIVVYTLDAEDKPADRSYCVKFQNSQGGYIELVGILTQRGWPYLDHKYDIGLEKPKNSL